MSKAGISLKIDDAQFTTALRKLHKYVGGEAERVIRNEASKAVQEFQHRTPPFVMKAGSRGGMSGLSNKAKKAGEGSVVRDILYHIQGRSYGYLRNFLEANGWARGDEFRRKDGTVYVVDFSRIAYSTREAEAFHDRRRSRRAT